MWEHKAFAALANYNIPLLWNFTGQSIRTIDPNWSHIILKIFNQKWTSLLIRLLQSTLIYLSKFTINYQSLSTHKYLDIEIVNIWTFKTNKLCPYIGALRRLSKSGWFLHSLNTRKQQNGNIRSIELMDTRHTLCKILSI